MHAVMAARGCLAAVLHHATDTCRSSHYVCAAAIPPRPVYDTAEALQCALINIVWSFAMLGHLHGNMARECFRALGLAPAEAFSDDQLVMLWSAHMRYQQLGHVMLDPNPLLAESYSVFMKKVGTQQ